MVEIESTKELKEISFNGNRVSRLSEINYGDNIFRKSVTDEQRMLANLSHKQESSLKTRERNYSVKNDENISPIKSEGSSIKHNANSTKLASDSMTENGKNNSMFKSNEVVSYLARKMTFLNNIIYVIITISLIQFLSVFSNKTNIV